MQSLGPVRRKVSMEILDSSPHVTVSLAYTPSQPLRFGALNDDLDFRARDTRRSCRGCSHLLVQGSFRELQRLDNTATLEL